MNIRKIARRTFLIGAVAAAGGVAVGFYYVRRPHDNPLLDGLAHDERAFNPYVKIAADGTVTIFVPRAEMGQGVQTTLAALVAEELDVELDAVQIKHGPAAAAYYNGAMLAEVPATAEPEDGAMASVMKTVTGSVSKVLGLQVTGGSSATRDAFDKMRHAGCAARMMLERAAAQRWNVDAARLETENGFVINPATGRKLGYGELAAEAAQVEPPRDIELRPKSQWRLLGKAQPRTDLRGKVTGVARFGIDVDLPDMLFGTVRISPRFGAKTKSFDDTAALKVPGVLKIVPIDTTFGAGFGVIAENTWAAFRGAEALEVEWQDAAYPADTAGLMGLIEQALDGEDGHVLADDGDAVAALDAAPADQVIRAEYRVPYLAHACMEPMNATAQWTGGRLEIWAPNQGPTLVRMAVASALDIDGDNITVNTTLLGGGFGRRAEVDFALYAAIVARAAGGRPVKVTWTREEDTRHDAYRPAAIGRFRARIEKGAAPKVIQARIAGSSPTQSIMARTFPAFSPGGKDPSIGEGSFDPPYAFTDRFVTEAIPEWPIPVGFWRSVGYSYNGFFHESFMDEIAHRSGIDPVKMRLELTQPWPAAHGVIAKVAEMADWGAPLPEGKGKGVAFVFSFGTWVAQVVQVANTEDGILIEKVWCAADPGEVLDPRIFATQMQSGIIFGLSSAIGQEITFADGEVEQGNFDSYDAVRLNQCPEIEVALLQNAVRMGGAGDVSPGLRDLQSVLGELGGQAFAVEALQPVEDGALAVGLEDVVAVEVDLLVRIDEGLGDHVVRLLGPEIRLLVIFVSAHLLDPLQMPVRQQVEQEVPAVGQRFAHRGQ